MDPNGARMVSPFQVEAKVPRCGPERRSSTNILLWFIIFIYYIIILFLDILGIFCPTFLECLNRNIPELMIMRMFRWKSVVTFSTFLVKSIHALGLANADWMGFLPGAETIWARWKKQRLDATVFLSLHCCVQFWVRAKANSLRHCTTSQYEEGLRLCACSFALRECPMLTVFTLRRNGASLCLCLFLSYILHLCKVSSTPHGD